MTDGFRIGLHTYIRLLGASVDASPDDNSLAGASNRSVLRPPFPVSGSPCAGLTCFHQPLRSSNPGGSYLLNSTSDAPQRPSSGRYPLQFPGLITCSMGENRRRDARMFGSRRDGCNIHVPALLEASYSVALGVVLPIDKAQVSASSVYQKGSQVTVTLVSNRTQSLLATAGMLSRRNP